MSLNFGKPFAFLLLCCLWAFCAADTFAQVNRQPEQSVTVESSPEILKSETETPVPAILEESRIDKPGIVSRSVQTIEDREKIISENKSDAEKTESLNARRQVETGGLKYDFHLNEERERPAVLSEAPTGGEKKISFSPLPFASSGDTKFFVSPDNTANAQNGKAEGFRWRAAIGQSLMFLAVQHGYAFTQPKTREALKGIFWKDYVQSVKSLRGWDDGGRFFTNYIAHPMQGSLTGFIYVQNDPKGLKQQFAQSGDYWRSRLKAMAWSAAWSTQFEIGPVSQASIGNVGLKGKQTWGDIVVTPTVGTLMLITEDAIDRFVMKRIERATDNFYVRIFARMLFSPTRTIANLFRFKEPWYRDRPLAH